MWHVTSNRVAYENARMRVVEDEVVTPSGAPGVATPFGAPGLYGSDGRGLLVAAQRELYEESGYVAGRWRKIAAGRITNGETLACLLHAAVALGKLS